MAATRLCNGPLSGNNEDLNSTITGPSPENLTFRTLYEALNYIFKKKVARKFAQFKKKQYLCTRFRKNEAYMVVLAQLAEHRIVVPSVVGFIGKAT